MTQTLSGVIAWKMTSYTDGYEANKNKPTTF